MTSRFLKKSVHAKNRWCLGQSGQLFNYFVLFPLAPRAFFVSQFARVSLQWPGRSMCKYIPTFSIKLHIFLPAPPPWGQRGLPHANSARKKKQVPVCSADPLHINAVKIFAYFFFVDNSWNFIFHACFGNGLRIPFLSYTIHRWLLWYVFLCYFCRGSEYLYVKGVKRLIYPPQHGHIVLLDLYDYPYLLFYSWCCIWCVLVWPVSVCYPFFLCPFASFKTIAGIFAHNNDTRVG